MADQTFWLRDGRAARCSPIFVNRRFRGALAVALSTFGASCRAFGACGSIVRPFATPR